MRFIWFVAFATFVTSAVSSSQKSFAKGQSRFRTYHQNSAYMPPTSASDSDSDLAGYFTAREYTSDSESSCNDRRPTRNTTRTTPPCPVDLNSTEFHRGVTLRRPGRTRKKLQIKNAAQKEANESSTGKKQPTEKKRVTFSHEITVFENYEHRHWKEEENQELMRL